LRWLSVSYFSLPYFLLSPWYCSSLTFFRSPGRRRGHRAYDSQNEIEQALYRYLAKESGERRMDLCADERLSEVFRHSRPGESPRHDGRQAVRKFLHGLGRWDTQTPCERQDSHSDQQRSGPANHGAARRASFVAPILFVTDLFHSVDRLPLSTF